MSPFAFLIMVILMIRIMFPFSLPIILMMIMIVVVLIGVVLVVNALNLLALSQASLSAHVGDAEDLGASFLTSPFAFKLIGRASAPPSVHSLRRPPALRQDPPWLTPACSLPPPRTKATSPTWTTPETTPPCPSAEGSPMPSFRLAVLTPDPPPPATRPPPCRPPLPRLRTPLLRTAIRTSTAAPTGGCTRPPTGRW